MPESADPVPGAGDDLCDGADPVPGIRDALSLCADFVPAEFHELPAGASPLPGPVIDGGLPQPDVLPTAADNLRPSARTHGVPA